MSDTSIIAPHNHASNPGTPDHAVPGGGAPRAGVSNPSVPLIGVPDDSERGVAISVSLAPSRLLLGAWAAMLLGLADVVAWALAGPAPLLAVPAAAAFCVLLARPPLPPINTLSVTDRGRIVVTPRQAKYSCRQGGHLHAKAWSPTVPCAIVTQNYAVDLMPGSKLGPGWLLLHLQNAAGTPMYVPILPDSIGCATMRGLCVALLVSERERRRVRRRVRRRAEPSFN